MNVRWSHSHIYLPALTPNQLRMLRQFNYWCQHVGLKTTPTFGDITWAHSDNAAEFFECSDISTDAASLCHCTESSSLLCESTAQPKLRVRCLSPLRLGEACANCKGLKRLLEKIIKSARRASLPCFGVCHVLQVNVCFAYRRFQASVARISSWTWVCKLPFVIIVIHVPQHGSGWGWRQSVIKYAISV